MDNQLAQRGQSGKRGLTAEFWPLLVDILAVLFNLSLLGVTLVLRLVAHGLRALIENHSRRVDHRSGDWLGEHCGGGSLLNGADNVGKTRDGLLSSQFRRHSGDSNPRPAHYTSPSLDLAPSDPLSRSVLDKSWSLAQLKAQVDNLTRENADLKTRLESGALVFDRYRADMRRQIDALRAQLDALKESHARDRSSNVESAERDGSGADGGIFHEDGLCANRTAGDGASETSGEDAQTHPVEDAQTHPVEDAQTHPVVDEMDMPADEGIEEDVGRVVRTPAFKKPRNHLTMCEHIFCKDFLY